MSTVHTARLRLPALALVICLIVALAAPVGAVAQPADNGPAPRVVHRAPVRVPTAQDARITGSGDGQTVAIVLSGAALLVAMTSAGYTVLRVGGGRSVRRTAS